MNEMVERVARAMRCRQAGMDRKHSEKLAHAAMAVEPTREMAIASTRVAAKILGGNIPDDEAEKIGRLLLKAAADAALQEDRPSDPGRLLPHHGSGP